MAGEINFGLSDPDAVYKGVANTNAMLQGFAQQKAGRLMASGDTTGAANALYASGNLAGGEQLQDRSIQIKTAQDAQQTKMIADVADALDNINQSQGPQAALAAFDHLTPLFKERGADDQHIAVMRQALQQDPNGFINAMSTHAAERLKQFNLAPGQSRYDGQGHVIASAPDVKTVGPGQSLVQLPGQQTTQPGAQTAPQPDQQDAPNSAPASADPFANGIDPNAVRQVESGGDPNAVSPAGASGTMQTMPTTLTDPGFGVQPAKDNSPAEKERVGKDYLAAMQQRYKNPVLSLIAYNWGPGATDKWLQQGADVGQLPPETRDYITKVAQAQQSGGPPPPLPPMAGDQSQTAQSGPKVLFKAGPEWRPLTSQEQQQYPNGEQVNTATGEIKNAPAGATPGSQPDTDTLTMLAQQYVTTGQMPAMGMNNAVMRNGILKTAAQIMKAHGYDGSDVAGFSSDYKASSAALAQLEKQRAMVGSFEGTVQQGIDYIIKPQGKDTQSIAEKALPNTGWRSANAAGVWLKQEMNDPDMGELQNRIDTVVNEYARVMSNATGGGVTSDAARTRAMTLLSSADSPTSLKAKLNTLQWEMGARIKSLDQQIAAGRSHLHNITGMFPDQGTSAAPSASGKVRTYNPKTGKLE